MKDALGLKSEITALPYFLPGEVILSKYGSMGRVDKATFHDGEWCYLFPDGGIHATGADQTERRCDAYVRESSVSHYLASEKWVIVDQKQRAEMSQLPGAKS